MPRFLKVRHLLAPSFDLDDVPDDITLEISPVLVRYGCAAFRAV